MPSWLIFDVRQNMKPWAALLAVLSIAFVQAAPVPADKVYGSRHAKIINAAATGEAQRVSVEYASERRDQPAVNIVAKGEVHPLSPETLMTLKRALLRDSRDDIASKLCTPSPGIRYVLRAKSESITVLICHSCRIVQVEKSGRIVAQRDADDIIADLRKVAASFIPEADLKHLP